MTFGEHLASYRRRRGMTQQELGDYLSISAQAISKWENDLSEPDVGTLKKLAALYEVPINTLLDYDGRGTITTEEPGASSLHTIGFCTSCGITVTEENEGERAPKVLCASCVRAREGARAASALDAERRRAEREESERRVTEGNVSYMKRRLIVSHIVAGLIGIPLLIFFLISVLSEGNANGVEIGVAIWFGYSVFAFVDLLFYEGAVREVLFNMATLSFKWPGLIFTFDLDGLLWLIGMKLLFALLGFVAGVLCAILGLLIAIFISPFVYPFKLIKHLRCIAKKDMKTFEDDFD